jgi:hypothetical protein
MTSRVSECDEEYEQEETEGQEQEEQKELEGLQDRLEQKIQEREVLLRMAGTQANGTQVNGTPDQARRIKAALRAALKARADAPVYPTVWSSLYGITARTMKPAEWPKVEVVLPVVHHPEKTDMKKKPPSTRSSRSPTKTPTKRRAPKLDKENDAMTPNLQKAHDAMTPNSQKAWAWVAQAKTKAKEAQARAAQAQANAKRVGTPGSVGVLGTRSPGWEKWGNQMKNTNAAQCKGVKDTPASRFAAREGGSMMASPLGTPPSVESANQVANTTNPAPLWDSPVGFRN